GEPVSNGVADIVEMRRPASDDSAQTGDGVVLPGQGRRDDWQLDRARHPNDRRGLDAAGACRCDGAVQHDIGDLGVPARGHDPDPQSGCPHWLDLWPTRSAPRSLPATTVLAAASPADSLSSIRCPSLSRLAIRYRRLCGVALTGSATVPVTFSP